MRKNVFFHDFHVEKLSEIFEILEIIVLQKVDQIASEVLGDKMNLKSILDTLIFFRVV